MASKNTNSGLYTPTEFSRACTRVRCILECMTPSQRRELFGDLKREFNQRTGSHRLMRPLFQGRDQSFEPVLAD